MFDFFGKDCTTDNDGGVRIATVTEGITIKTMLIYMIGHHNINFN